MKCSTNHRYPCRDTDRIPEYEDRKPHPHPHPKHQTETILRCGTNIGTAPFSVNLPILDGESDGFRATVLGTVPLDTSHLIDPTIKIDFSSLISFRTIGVDNYFLRLVFRLSKVCGGCPIPLGIWAFEKVRHIDEVAQPDGAYIQQTESFCFSWCGCDDCPDCCRYIVDIIDLESSFIDYENVTNISLTAMAVGLKKVY